MFDRRPWLDLVWLGLLSLAFQAFWMVRLEHPSYFDAYYYTVNAQQLAAGEGFTTEIIWQYLDAPDALPAPSHTYWMPLTSLVGAAGYRLLGTFRGAQLPFWLMAGLLPLLSYAISWRLTRERWQARTAALFTAAGGYYAAYWVQPTTFVLFAWVGGGCLLALAYAQERPGPVAWLVAGVGAGLAHLTRADGALLLAVALFLWFLQLRDWRLQRLETDLRAIAAGLFLLFAGYLLVMGGWFWRMWALIGRPLSTAGTETLFLTEYNDVFAYNRHFALGDYLDWGWANILISKLEASWLAIQTFIAVTGLTAFTFFMVIAWIRLARCSGPRRSPVSCRFLRPFTWYTLVLFGAMSLIFTFPGQRGSLLHSSTALWPWSMALVAAGLGVVVDWIAARRTRWQPQLAKRLFAVSFLILAYVVTFFVALGQPLRQEEAAVYRTIGERLPEETVVMTSDPPGFHYHTGLRAVVAPNEPPAVMLEAARRYGAAYLLLDKEHPPPLADLYAGQTELPAVRFVEEFGDGYRLYRLDTGR